MLADFAEVVKKGTRDDRLLSAIDWDRLPRQVAIIMDGNGRWAAQRGQPRIAGHRAGVEAVRAAVDTGARLGLGALTLYAFSTENWKRPRYEVEALMRMLRKYLRIEIDEIDRQNIRFQTIGRTAELARSVRASKPACCVCTSAVASSTPSVTRPSMSTTSRVGPTPTRATPARKRFVAVGDSRGVARTSAAPSQ